MPIGNAVQRENMLLRPYPPYEPGNWAGISGAELNRPDNYGFTMLWYAVLNMSVDHLLVAILGGMVAIFLPVPVMFLGIIVTCVQTLVFCLLTAIYIGMATEHAHDH